MNKNKMMCGVKIGFIQKAALKELERKLHVP